MFAVKGNLALLACLEGFLLLAMSCSVLPLNDTTAPAIENITTSSKVLAKSDCIPTSLTVRADVTDNSRVDHVTLWYRVGEDQDFVPTPMAHAERDQYTAAVKGLDIPGGEYGTFEFYIVAQDPAGNQAKSTPDKSVQFLPCVG
jgi:hypothetical protein